MPEKLNDDLVTDLDHELHEAIKFAVMTSINLDSRMIDDAAQCIITAEGIIAKVRETIVDLSRDSEVTND